ncbi:MAG TPA: hypothetical protein VHJ39_00645 [Solirubrobacteraceae bacterium]|jgi:hypothetical protein|nr:hypothetical protein [Solirubrobacteraceae bacterium]
MLGRRFIILVAVLMGLTALAASLAPRQPVPRDRRAADATPVPTTPAEGSVVTRARTISTAEAPRRINVRRGTLLELEVEGDELDSVELLDEVSPITPESNARFDIYADRAGMYPIKLVDEERLIGTLVVR